MLRAIAETRISGVATTLPTDVAILSHPDFAAGTHSTKWVEQTLDLRQSGGDPSRSRPPPPVDDEIPTVQRDVTAEVDGRRFSVKLWVPDLGTVALPRGGAGAAQTCLVGLGGRDRFGRGECSHARHDRPSPRRRRRHGPRSVRPSACLRP